MYTVCLVLQKKNQYVENQKKTIKLKNEFWYFFLIFVRTEVLKKNLKYKPFQVCLATTYQNFK